jgi:hypothetical protein
MKDSARSLKLLQARLLTTDEPLERQALKRRIGDIAHKLAAAEYRRKAGPLARELAGAY